MAIELKRSKCFFFQMKQDVGKVGEIERLLCLDHQVQMELCYERNKKIEMLNPLNRVEFTR